MHCLGTAWNIPCEFGVQVDVNLNSLRSFLAAHVASLFLILMLRGCAIHSEEEKCSGYLSACTFA